MWICRMPKSLHPVCVGTISLKGDTCLLVRQATGASLAGQWSIPWGYVDEAETPNSGLNRTRKFSSRHAEREERAEQEIERNRLIACFHLRYARLA